MLEWSSDSKASARNIYSSGISKALSFSHPSGFRGHQTSQWVYSSISGSDSKAQARVSPTGLWGHRGPSCHLPHPLGVSGPTGRFCLHSPERPAPRGSSCHPTQSVSPTESQPSTLSQCGFSPVPVPHTIYVNPQALMHLLKKYLLSTYLCARSWQCDASKQI